MPEIEVTIEIYCARCEKGICNNAEATRGRQRNEPQFRIEPCADCLAKESKEGYEDGYDAGINDGKKEGYDEGYEAARKEFEKAEEMKP